MVQGNNQLQQVPHATHVAPGHNGLVRLVQATQKDPPRSQGTTAVLQWPNHVATTGCRCSSHPLIHPKNTTLHRESRMPVEPEKSMSRHTHSDIQHCECGARTGIRKRYRTHLIARRVGVVHGIKGIHGLHRAQHIHPGRRTQRRVAIRSLCDQHELYSHTSCTHFDSSNLNQTSCTHEVCVCVCVCRVNSRMSQTEEIGKRRDGKKKRKKEGKKEKKSK
jgi:hypothetical protein